MKHTDFLTAFIAIGIGLSSITASAVTNTYNLGTITNTSLSYGDTFVIADGTFSDTFNFTILPNERFSAFVGDQDLLPNFEIDPNSFGAKLTGPGLGAGIVGTASGDTFKFNPMLLTAGDYALNVYGTISGTTGASFAGTMMAAPVPEPESYVTLFVGIGILGFIGRRRLTKIASNYRSFGASSLNFA